MRLLAGPGARSERALWTRQERGDTKRLDPGRAGGVQINQRRRTLRKQEKKKQSEKFWQVQRREIASRPSPTSSLRFFLLLLSQLHNARPAAPAAAVLRPLVECHRDRFFFVQGRHRSRRRCCSFSLEQRSTISTPLIRRRRRCRGIGRLCFRLARHPRQVLRDQGRECCLLLCVCKDR